jgi:hypothetical protein
VTCVRGGPGDVLVHYLYVNNNEIYLYLNILIIAAHFSSYDRKLGRNVAYYNQYKYIINNLKENYSM